MTESSCIATRHPYPNHDTTGSIGIPLKNLDMKIVDDDGKDISEYDVRGELCLRGPTVIKGYYDNPDANARDWDKENYFHTGDIGYCDGKTKLWYIVDRKKVSSAVILILEDDTDHICRNLSKFVASKSLLQKSKEFFSPTQKL